MTSPKRAHFSTAFATEEKTTDLPTASEPASDSELVVVEAEPEKGSEQKKPTPQQKSRANKVQIPVYVAPEARKQLKILSAETGRTQEDLLKEAINDFFRKHNKPVIA